MGMVDLTAEQILKLAEHCRDNRLQLFVEQGRVIVKNAAGVRQWKYSNEWVVAFCSRKLKTKTPRTHAKPRQSQRPRVKLRKWLVKRHSNCDCSVCLPYTY